MEVYMRFLYGRTPHYGAGIRLKVEEQELGVGLQHAPDPGVIGRNLTGIVHLQEYLPLALV
jgi:hypothetical protein